MPIPETWASFPTVQPLPDGGVLIVGSRAQWTPGGPEQNAEAFDANGDLLRTACVGDGVAHARTTASGELWVGYTDEGVYGNMGWGWQEGPAPIGSPGILRFAPTLEVAWEFPATREMVIDDCYAMNWDGKRLWASYYSDFRLLAIEDGKASSLKSSMPGAHALVTNGTEVAYVGGYRDEYDRVATGRTDDDAKDFQVSRLVMPDGSELPREASIVGHANELHVFAGTRWLRVDLEDLPD